MLSFLVVVTVLDTVFGWTNRMLEQYAHTQNYHCMYEAREDILILGSSYAVREIVPQVLTEHLGMTCYNAGEAGNGALCAWVRYNMFLRNHTPKVIAYALTPGYDYIDIGNDYTEYLKSFKGYYGMEHTINEVYDDLGHANDAIKLKCNFVKFNSEWITTAFYAMTQKNKGTQGYDPFYNVFTPYEIPDSAGTENVKVDERKFKYLNRLMRDATSRHIRIVCFLPPHYYNTYHAQSHERALALCRELNIPVIDNYNASFYKKKPSLFGDKDHLNHQGALIYTAQLADSIKKYIK